MNTQKYLLPAFCFLFLAQHVFAQNTSFEETPKSIITEPILSFSMGFASHSWVNSDDDDFSKNALAYLPTLQVRIPDTAVSFILKGGYTNVDFEDNFSYDNTSLIRYGYCDAFIYEEESKEAFFVDFEVRYDFYKDDVFNLYASAGLYYEKASWEADVTKALYSSQYGLYPYEYLGTQKNEEDGTAFIGHFGAELFYGDWYANAEIGFLGKVYDSDKNQTELSGIIGYYLSDFLRLDANVRYMTDWKELYIGGACTFQY